MEEKCSLKNGYTNIPDIVFKHPDLDWHTAFLYGYIQRLSYRFGYCFATNRALADFVGVSISTISRDLKILRDHDLIETESVQGHHGHARQRYIYVHDFHLLENVKKQDRDAHPCTDGLIAGASHKNTSKNYKTYMSHPRYYGVYRNVCLTESELDALCEDLGSILACLMICSLSEEMSATGRIYQNHYHQIRNEYTKNIKKYSSPNSDWIRKASKLYKKELDEFLLSRRSESRVT